MGFIEKTGFFPIRTGKTPFLVPEEFPFKKAFRNRAAIHGHKGILFTAAQFVNCPGDQFLASA